MWPSGPWLGPLTVLHQQNPDSAKLGLHPRHRRWVIAKLILNQNLGAMLNPKTAGRCPSKIWHYRFWLLNSSPYAKSRVINNQKTLDFGSPRRPHGVLGSNFLGFASWPGRFWTGWFSWATPWKTYWSLGSSTRFMIFMAEHKSNPQPIYSQLLGRDLEFYMPDPKAQVFLGVTWGFYVIFLFD